MAQPQFHKNIPQQSHNPNNLDMSDLAPFVAAALWDKTIADMMEENQKLRAQLSSMKSVEITGPGGFPIYARGKLDEDGSYHDHRSPKIWRVKFTEEVEECPISHLKDIEVWVGGTIRANFGEFSSYYNIMDHGDYYYKENGRREKGFTVCFQPGTVWMDFNSGWTDEELAAANMHLPSNCEGKEVLDFLCNSLAPVNPSKTCQFKSIAPAVRGIRGLIHEIPGWDKRQPKQLWS